MARPAPGPLLKTLPDLAHAAKIIEHWVNAPVTRLGDLSIRQLVESYSDGTPVWLTGSNVWMPAVFYQRPPAGADADLIFSSQEACDMFVKGALFELNRRTPGYTFKKGTNAFGSARILFPESPKPVKYGNLFARILSASDKPDSVIDAWSLAPGESVAEVLMSYQSDYQRCAYLMNRSVAGSAGAITRVVRPVSKPVFARRYGSSYE